MSRRVPLRSQEGRRLVERGPAWREHPDYYAPPEPEEIPWHTEDDVGLATTRMQNYARSRGVRLHDEMLRNLARVALGMRPR
jgi:hypothetical protein